MRQGLSADVAVRLGTLDLVASLTAPPGSVTALLGPNGAGKTTLLRCLAGFVLPAGGRIELDGTVLDAPPGVHVAPDRRGLGILHQDYLLFPHLSALDNVAFGPRSAGVPGAQARAVAAQWLARVGLPDVAGARPRALSGGQQQRVALARALAVDPAMLLLDEPLAALDVRTRPEVRRDLRRHLRDYAGVTVLVTHDLADAVALADRLVVLEDGRVSHAGPVREVLATPRTRYVADLVGTNLLQGRGTGDAVVVDGVPLPVPGRGEVLVTLRPGDVRRDDRATGGADTHHASGTVAWQATVLRVEPGVDRVELLLDRPAGLVAAWPPAQAASVREGAVVAVRVRAEDVGVSPAGTPGRPQSMAAAGGATLEA